jgi:formylglycine-generating enzyme required for sulfatase activity
LLLIDGASVLLPKAPALLIRGDREQLRLRRITRPDWASAVGRDRFGLWAELTVEDSSVGAVVHRLRWMPPGRFTMGSQKDEPGRFDREGPAHEVSIGDGFWLFETPCTQCLWQAVMGDNPSKFSDPLRPVEQVSWEDAQTFISRINEQRQGLNLSLPSEAQWEYACRAGTDTALYTGPIAIRGDADAPALDAIAWYGGNSADGFELDNGVDLSFHKQRAHKGKAGPRRVKGKAANAWGLYDMLGNVWEWVQDGWQDNYVDAPSDGSARGSGDKAARVVRGGSWLNEARNCRCATRYRYRPVGRSGDLGFRCARVQP